MFCVTFAFTLINQFTLLVSFQFEVEVDYRHISSFSLFGCGSLLTVHLQQSQLHVHKQKHHVRTRVQESLCVRACVYMCVRSSKTFKIKIALKNIALKILLKVQLNIFIIRHDTTYFSISVFVVLCKFICCFDHKPSFCFWIRV